MTTLAGPPSPLPATPPSLAFVGCFTTAKRLARGQGIDVYRIAPPPAPWVLIDHVGNLVNPSFLITDPARKILYAVHGDADYASAFAIEPSTGRLRPLGQAPTGGLNGVHQALDPSSRFLVVANYASGSLALLPVRPDGGLEAFSHLLPLPGATGPHRTEQTLSHPHHVVFDPSGRFLLVPDKGLDRIFVLAVDADRGGLRIVSQALMRPGAGPRHIVFHPSRPIAFVVNELDSSVATCGFDAAAGVLTPRHVAPCLPPGFFGASTAAAIVITPCGRFVHASNRGQDGITHFAFDAAEERLRVIGWTPAQGREPRFMILTPHGEQLLVANEQGDTIVPFAIDAASGGIAASGAALPSASPCTIAFL